MSRQNNDWEEVQLENFRQWGFGVPPSILEEICVLEGEMEEHEEDMKE